MKSHREKISNHSNENGGVRIVEENLDRLLPKRTTEFTELPDSGPVDQPPRVHPLQRRLTEYIVLTEDTTCGIGCCKGRLLQRFANKKAYVILYGILGCIFSASYSYFNGTITTLEKRFKIPSKTTGKFVLRHFIF